MWTVGVFVDRVEVNVDDLRGPSMRPRRHLVLGKVRLGDSNVHRTGRGTTSATPDCSAVMEGDGGGRGLNRKSQS